jgi:hypothetical protein
MNIDDLKQLLETQIRTATEKKNALLSEIEILDKEITETKDTLSKVG